MQTKTTHGIKISVRAKYHPGYSRPDSAHFVFTYLVTIQNCSDDKVQLLRRHWFIFDSCGENREVEGEGVVGQQPVLLPGDVYEYESSCNLLTDLGAMRGTYLFARASDGARFIVEIPEFALEAEMKLN